MVDWHSVLYGHPKGSPNDEKEWWQRKPFGGSTVGQLAGRGAMHTSPLVAMLTGGARLTNKALNSRSNPPASTARRGGSGTFSMPQAGARTMPNYKFPLSGLDGGSNSGPGRGIAAPPVGDPLAEFIASFSANYLDPDLAASMAAAEFDPQLAAIAEAKRQAEERTARNKTEVGGLFGALSSSILGRQDEIGGIYDNATNAITTAHDQGTNNIREQYNRSAAEQEAMMKRLGVEEAAPDVLRGGSEAESFLTGLMENSKAVNTSAQHGFKANALENNERSSQTAGMAGANAQTALTQQLNDLLAQQDLQSMELSGQRAARQNDLFFQIDNTNFQRQSAAAEFMQQIQKQQAEAQEKLAGAAGGGANFDDEWKSMDPWSRIEYQVGSRTGNPNNAKQAIDFVRDQISTQGLGFSPGPGQQKATPAEISNLIRSQNSRGSGVDSHTIDMIVTALAQAGYFG